MAEGIPQVVANCKILSKLGQGGMGSVYKAVHTTLGRSIALKILPAEFTRSPEYVARFMREARAVANLSHPNIVGVHDAGEQNGIYYIGMEMVDGASIGALTRHYRPLSEVECLNFLLQAAKGMAAAHARGLVHRDIKPENMLVSREGYLKIVDFGLVLEQSSDSHLTRTGTFLGTPVYMSPEQCDGDVADARSDLYSLGATFYCLLTGKPPFQAPTALGILYKHKFEQPQDPKSAVPDLSEHTSKILLKMLQKKREDRYQNAQELIEDVEKAQKSVAGKENNWSLKDALATIKPPPEVPLEFAPTPNPNAAYTPTVLPGQFDPRSATGQGLVPGMTPAPMTATGRTPAYSPGSTPAPTGFEPTMVSAGQPTQGQQTVMGQGFEPTLVTPGRMPMPQGGATPAPYHATPAPGPLPEMPTPTGPSANLPAAKTSKLPVLAGVAVAAIVFLGTGGYFLFGSMQRKQELNTAKTNIEKFIEDGNFEKAERERKQALIKFSDDQDIRSFETRIVDGYTKRIKTELEKDVRAADQMLGSALVTFPEEEKLKSLRKEVQEAYFAQIQALVKKSDREGAERLAAAALRTFPDDDRISKIQKELVRTAVAADLRFDDIVKEGKAAFAQGKYKEAEDKFAEANQLKPGDPVLEASLRKPLFDYYTKSANDLARDGKLADAITSAKKATSFGAGDDLVKALELRVRIEGLVKEAENLFTKDDWRKAAEKYDEAARLVDEKADPAQKQALIGKASGTRLAGYEKQAGTLETAGKWDEAIPVLEEALNVLGKNTKIQARLDAAKQKALAGKNYDSSLKSAQEALTQQKYPVARAQFENAMALKPNDPVATAGFHEADALVKIESGNKFFGEQDWDKALKAYEEAGVAAAQLKSSQGAKLQGDIKGYQAQVVQRTQDIDKKEKDAVKAFEDGKLAAAITLYKDLSTLNRSKQAKYAGFIDSLEKESAFRSLLEGADAAASIGEFPKARDLYQKALDKKPGDEKAKADVDARLRGLVTQEKILAGDTAAKALDWKAAKAAYEQALQTADEKSKAKITQQIKAAEGQLSKLVELDQKVQQAMKEEKYDVAQSLYQEMAKLDPKNKNLYETALKDLEVKIKDNQAKIEARKREEEARRKAEEERLAREAAARAKQERYTNGLATVKQKIASRDFDGAESSLKTVLQEFPADASTQDLQNQINEGRKKRFDQQGESDVWNKVQTDAARGQYAAAKATADQAKGQYPVLAQTFQTWSDALAALVAAETATSSSSRALDDGLRVANVPNSARGTLEGAKAQIAGILPGAQRSFLNKNFTEAVNGANNAGATARNLAKNALTSAADACDRAAAEYEKGGGGGGGGGKRPISVGEEELPTGGGGGGSKGDPKKAGEARAAGKALRDLANNLR